MQAVARVLQHLMDATAVKRLQAFAKLVADKLSAGALLAGLQFLAAMIETGRPASALVRQFDRVPQLLKNVRYAADRQPLAAPEVTRVIEDAKARMGGQGRVLIRKSGTEPLIRVMAECTDEGLLRAVVDDIVAAVERAA